MNRYGTDAPDLTFELPIQDLTNIFENTEFKVFRRIVDQGGIVRAIVLPSKYKATRSDIEWIRSEIAKMNVQGVSGDELEQEIVDLLRDCARIKYLHNVCTSTNLVLNMYF